MNCTKCGGATQYKEGTAKKTGNPYKGYKCLDKQCDWFEFVKQPAHQLTVGPSAPATVSIELSNISNQLKVVTLQLDKIWERLGKMQTITEEPDVN